MSSTTTESGESLVTLIGETKAGPVPRPGPETSVRAPVAGSTDMIWLLTTFRHVDHPVFQAHGPRRRPAP